MKSLSAGALAGLAATVPMTWAMELMHRALPEHERHPLPPREITQRLSRLAMVEHKLSERQQAALTVGSHLSYGAAMGTLFSLMTRKSASASIGGATLFGLLVWAVSYFQVLPGVGLLSSAKHHPPRRNALMVIAHLVWGSALGAFLDMMLRAHHRRGRSMFHGRSLAGRRE